jgi:cell division protein ZapA
VKQMEVSILGQSYILGCPEGGESLLLEAVGRVDSEMTTIRDSGRVKARERIAVLAALNLAYALAERPTAPSPDDVKADAAIDLDALIRRVDQALKDDGKLL